MLLRMRIIGYLSRSGSVNECDKVRYRPVQQKPQTEEKPLVTSTSGEEEEKEIKFTITIPNDSFAGEVTKHLHDPIIIE